MTALINTKDKLHRWWDSLPDSKHPDTIGQGPISRAALHLRLEYLSVRMFAGRLFITPREPIRNNASPSSVGLNESIASSHKTLSSNAQRRNALVADCIDASVSVVQTCKLLQNSIGLARSSYTEYGSCRAALLVIIAQCLQDPADNLREALHEGLSMLREMSATGDSARFDVALIEAFASGVSRLGVRAAPPGSKNTGAPWPEADYEGFKRWEMLWQSEALQQDPRIETGLEAAFGLSTRPVAPQFGNGADGATGHWHGGHARQSISALAPNGFSFGVDGSLNSMPILEDLSAMFGGTYAPGIDGMPGGPGQGDNWSGM